MVFLDCHYYSHVLRMDTSIYLLLPQRKNEPIEMASRKYPVLYLLHGQSQDHTAWIRHSNIETYLANKDVAVVMPNLHKSFYTNMVHGDQYFTFISEEVPIFIQKYFPISDKREDTYVAGLSMGGYGAFKLALTYPNKYKWAASLSGAVDIGTVYSDLYNKIEDFNTLDVQQKEYIDIFGTPADLETSNNDLRKLALELDKSACRKPSLFQCCGHNDYLRNQNNNFQDFMHKNTSLNLIYEESDGNHNWSFWNRKLLRAIEIFELLNEN